MAIFEATYEREDGSMFEKEYEINENECETRTDFWTAALKKALAEETEEIHMFNLEWTV